jgi:AraC-like DNA-binding protein
MAQITPLWRSAELSLHRFHHPVEHEDRPYEEIADSYMASFVEEGTFDLAVGEGLWRVAPGDVMLSHPGMRFSAGFQGKGFNDVCLSLTYHAANDEAFDTAGGWARSKRPVLVASNRLRYLRWGLQRAVAADQPMLAEYCAGEIFRERGGAEPAALFSERRLAWYAERVHAVRERLEADFAHAHTVSALARSVGMSMFHFARVFAELTGMPPHRYLALTRLKAAHAMLRQGRGVTDTCYACGFGDLSHFSRSFRKAYGVAPSRLTG